MKNEFSQDKTKKKGDSSTAEHIKWIITVGRMSDEIFKRNMSTFL